jgi:hypothetical protein
MSNEVVDIFLNRLWRRELWLPQVVSDVAISAYLKIWGIGTKFSLDTVFGGKGARQKYNLVGGLNDLDLP